MNGIVKNAALPVVARYPKPTVKTGVFVVRNLPRARRAKKKADAASRPAAIVLVAGATLAVVAVVLRRRRGAASERPEQSATEVRSFVATAGTPEPNLGAAQPSAPSASAQ